MTANVLILQSQNWETGAAAIDFAILRWSILKVGNEMLSRVILAAALAASALTAQADEVNLVGGWNITWNTGASSVSPTQDIQIQNMSAGTNAIFNGYDLGLIFQRVEGSGQIALGTASNPSSNSIVPSWLGAPQIGSGSITSVGTEALISNEALNDIDYAVPNSATSLVTVDFTSGEIPPTPGSVFEVFSDDGYSDYFNHAGNSTPYANNSGSNLLLGTITVVAAGGGTWASVNASGGTWGTGANWVGGTVPSFGALVFPGSGGVATVPVTLTQSEPADALVLGDGVNSTGYHFTGGTINMGVTAGTSSIAVLSGNHSISSAIVLNGNLAVSASAGTTLQVSGNISEATPGTSLTKLGNGTQLLSGADTYSGGTWVEAGTLIAADNEAIPKGSSLYVGNDLSAFGVAVPTEVPAALAMVTAVPEPGTLALLVTVLVAGLGVWQRKGGPGATSACWKTKVVRRRRDRW